MKRFITLITLFSMQFGCSDNCSREKANVFQEVTNSDISNLEKINDLILKNIDTLIKADENNESDSVRGKDKFHLISAGGLERFLPKEDLLKFDNLNLAFNNTKNKFYFYQVYYRASDSTFNYQLRLDVCDSSKQAIDITHYLLFRTNPQNYSAYKNKDLAKEMKVNRYWTYYIDNTLNDPY